MSRMDGNDNDAMVQAVAHRGGLRAVLVGICGVLCLLVLAASARADFQVTGFDAGVFDEHGAAASQAGSHPFQAESTVEVNTAVHELVPGWDERVPQEGLRNVDVALPPGLVGNPQAVPQCAVANLASKVDPCAAAAAVGVIGIPPMGTSGFGDYGSPPNPDALQWVPLYNMVPPPGVPAAFGFSVQNVTVTLVARVRPTDHGITFSSNDIPQTVPLYRMKVILWGVPADPSHDHLRGSSLTYIPPGSPQEQQCPGVAGGAGNFGVDKPCDHTASTTPAGVPAVPFLRNPTSCTPAGQGLPVTLAVDTYEGSTRTKTIVTHDAPPNAATPLGPTGCDALGFAPSIAVKPDSSAADAPTGLGVDLSVPQEAWGSVSGLSQPDLRTAVVTLPRGMAISPTGADGLDACSDAQLGVGSAAAAACPLTSKIGSVSVDTPLLAEPMGGSIFLGTQESRDPQSGRMFRIFIEARDAMRGVTIKLRGAVRADPASGQLEATFDDNPQLPFSTFHLRFKGGPRSVLQTPATCGMASTASVLTPWSGSAPAVLDTSMTIDQGCDAAGSFVPALHAGVTSPRAGRSSAFTTTLTRERGQNVAGIDVTLPPGLLAAVKGVPLCEGASAASGDCPAASRVGTTTIAVGPGPSPLVVPQAGKAPTAVYLGGPYRGEPYSLVIVVPAQAGPFDLGTVAVRASIAIDPRDAHVTVRSDALPQILGGVPLEYRTINVTVDRPGFMANPTNCRPMQVAAQVHGAAGATATLASRFQVGECQALPLSPTVVVQGGGKGGTKRYTHPSLRVRVTQTGGQAHLRNANVVLPRAFNVDLRAPALKAACPRPVYAQDKCSKLATVGTVRAVTPVFAEPLTGPAFLIQKKGQLPDIVMRLANVHYRIDLIGVLDFLGDGRVITRVSNIPDAPISSFELTIKGGKGGSLLDRSDLCAKPAATQATFLGQNGKRSVKTPTTRIVGCLRAAGGRS